MKNLYRLEERYDEYGNVTIECLVFSVMKETLCGYWIVVHNTEKKWVSKNTTKKYACDSKQGAKESFKHRKSAQIKILSARIELAKEALKNLDNIDINEVQQNAFVTFGDE